MHLLYLDDSGNENNPDDKHFVLAGVALFEREIHWLAQRLARIQSKHLPGSPPVPFHATKIRARKGFWRRVSEEARASILREIADAVRTASPSALALFGAVIEKTDRIHGEQAVRKATQELCRRFDQRLVREHRARRRSQRGLLVFSKGKYDERFKLWVEEFRTVGTELGELHNLADIPYFASMHESRILQVADYIAHALFLLYERRDPGLITPVLSRFDQSDGVLHGLFHYVSGNPKTCDCPACASRTQPKTLGSWLSSTEAGE